MLWLKSCSDGEIMFSILFRIKGCLGGKLFAAAAAAAAVGGEVGVFLGF